MPLSCFGVLYKCWRKRCVFLLLIVAFCSVCLRIAFTIGTKTLYKNIRLDIFNQSIINSMVSNINNQHFLESFSNGTLKRIGVEQLGTRTNTGRHLENLLDVPDNFDTGIHHFSANATKKIILWYNHKGQVNHERTNGILSHCEYNNCVSTGDLSKQTVADAVIFVVSYKHVGNKPPIKRGKPDQVWIFKLGESPYGRNFRGYDSPEWTHQVNWTSSLMLDTDLPHGPGFVRTRTEVPAKNYSAIYDLKTKTALWIASNCNAPSKRDIYVKRLQESGLQVDVYGTCGSFGRKSADEMNKIIPQYKFYLSFENSLCEDYVTEKFIDRYNNDWILVARGGANYSKILPMKTYINTADFASPKALAEYLNELGSDRARYLRLLEAKDRFEGRYGVGYHHSLCELCHRLNHLHAYRKTYKNVKDFLKKGRCVSPTDV